MRHVEVHKQTAQTLLGVGFDHNPGGAGVVVSELHPSGLLAQGGEVAVGDVLLSVNGTPTNAPFGAGTQLQQLSGRLVLKLLSAAPPGPAPPVRQSRGPANRQVRCVYAYEAQEDDELTMEAGQIIDVIDSEGDWWMGRIGVRIGNFPSNYVVPYEVGQTI